MFGINYEEDSDILYDNIKVYTDNYKKSLQINFSSEDLDTFCLYVSNLDSEYVTHTALTNTLTLFESLDTKPYNINDELRSKIEYIKLVLDARVNLALSTRTLIKNYVMRNCDMRLKDFISTEIIDGMKNSKISDSTCKYLNSLVYEYLIEGYSLEYSKKLSAIFEKKESGGYKRISEFSLDLKNLITEMNGDIRKSEEFMREGKGFDLNPKNIKHEIYGVMKKLRSPINKLQIGIQYLNRMLNGGFESGRSYAFIGIPGSGKSVVLLSIALWIMKYNRIPRVDGTKAAVLFISQENSKEETFERIFNMNISSDDIREFTDEDIEEKFKEAGILANDDDSINFIFKYFGDKEIGVKDIDAIISDYEKQNIKIIAVIQDYIEKLKPNQNYSEERFSLGSNATELSELAKARQIPVITAAQLNRMASSIVDNAISNNKVNTTKLLGKANISESWNMIKNFDCCIIINREIDDRNPDEEKEYMGFKLEKFRGKPNKERIYVFLHPFEEGNGVSLIPDIEGKVLSRLSIEDFDPMNVNTLNKGGRPDFSDYDTSNDDFMASFVDIISADYKDSDKNYQDLYKEADNVVDKMKKLQEREKDIIEKRKRDKKSERKYYKVDENGLIKIHRKK